MYKSYILDKDISVSDGVITYLPDNDYKVVTTYKDYDYIEMKILTDIIHPILTNNTYPGVHSIVETEVNKDLLSKGSYLSYLTNEILYPYNFYWKLDYDIDKGNTRRRLVFNLYFKDMKCYSTNELLDKFKVEGNLGPLIASSITMNYGPRWYSDGMFEDFANQTNGLEIVKDKYTYIFYKNPIIYLQSNIDDDVDKINDYFTHAMSAGLFPRNTPIDVRMNKRLISLDNGQYKCELKGDLYKTVYEETIILNGIDYLFWFLLWLYIKPTYNWILDEMEIYIKEKVQINYRTKYLPDFNRVMKLVTLEPIDMVVNYNKVSATNIYFYDNESEEDKVLSINVYIDEINNIKHKFGDLIDRYNIDS